MNAQSSDSLAVPTLENTKTKQWIAPLVVATYCGAILATYKYADTKIRDFAQSNHSGFLTGVSKTVTNIGLGKYQAIAFGATTLLAFAIKNTKLKKTATVWGTSLVLNSILTSQLKYTFQRHRPNTGDPYNSFDWRGGNRSNTSFPSAHTSNVFATATIFASMYKDKKWIPPLAYGIATLVGLSRIYDNAHWGSDVLMGAAIGYLSAKASIKLYRLAAGRLRFLPQASSKSVSVVLLCRLN